MVPHCKRIRLYDCIDPIRRRRRAIASAYRVDEARNIRDKAEAVRLYAKQARDLEMQNMAAEIRIRAERRAGQLLSDMAKNLGTRGEGRPRNDGTKVGGRVTRLGVYQDRKFIWVGPCSSREMPSVISSIKKGHV